MRIIVTGGAGFIGSHVSELLLAENNQVIVVDNLITGQLSNLPKNDGLVFIQKDINKCLRNDFSGGVDAIIHLAASPSVNDSWENIKVAHDNNLTSTASVIMLCKELGIRRIVFASSAAVYGNASSMPLCEDLPVEPISPYGCQKLFSERYLAVFSNYCNLSVVCLRFFNVFGPRQSRHSQYSGVITKFVTAMMAGKQLTIFGSGNQSRDFVYVKDVARACCLALNAEVNRNSIVINVGTGTPTSINDLATSLKKFFPNWTEGTIYSSDQPGDISHSLADIGLAKSVLGYSPSYTLLEGLKGLFV